MLILKPNWAGFSQVRVPNWKIILISHLLVKHKDVSVVAGAKGRERLEVAGNSFAGLNAATGNVGDHPVKVLGIFVGEMSVGVGHDESPERIPAWLGFGGLEGHLGAGRRFLGLDDVALKTNNQ